jgi:type VI secretion system ImpA family protein
MGEWERPLKNADWPTVLQLCTQVLAGRSKDLQVAVQWLDAAVHLHQVDGLVAGIELLCGLVEQHWDGLHPRLDENEVGDEACEARIAPLVWLNETLPHTLRMDLVLLPLPGRKPPRLTLEDWDRQGRGLIDENSSDVEHALPTRDQLLRILAQPQSLAHITHMQAGLKQALGNWESLCSLVDRRLGRQGPSLAHVSQSLLQLLRLATRWLPPSPHSSADTTSHEGAGQQLPPVHAPAIIGNSTGPLAITMTSGFQLNSREAAYQMLETIANYLKIIEPHSPTPYLVQRAINWGKLPLPELMLAMLREEGDMNRVFHLLNIPGPAD